MDTMSEIEAPGCEVLVECFVGRGVQRRPGKKPCGDTAEVTCDMYCADTPLCPDHNMADATGHDEPGCQNFLPDGRTACSRLEAGLCGFCDWLTEETVFED